MSKFATCVGGYDCKVGYNPELADFENPTGAIYMRVYYVWTRIDGEDFEYIHFHTFEDVDEAWALVRRINEKIDSDSTWTPKDNKHWIPRKIYGSKQWNADDELGLMDDEELQKYHRGY